MKLDEIFPSGLPYFQCKILAVERKLNTIQFMEPIVTTHMGLSFTSPEIFGKTSSTPR